MLLFSPVRKIVFIDANGKRYLTTSQTIMFEKDIDFYELIKGGQIEITYIDNELFPEKVLLLEEEYVKNTVYQKYLQ